MLGVGVAESRAVLDVVSQRHQSYFRHLADVTFPPSKFMAIGHLTGLLLRSANSCRDSITATFRTNERTTVDARRSAGQLLLGYTLATYMAKAKAQARVRAKIRVHEHEAGMWCGMMG